jgi:hypothetical protein
MKATAAAAMLVFAGLSTAQAAEPATLALACQGTVTNIMAAKPKPEPVSMGITIHFAEGTVEGFGAFPAKIRTANELTVGFERDSEQSGIWTIYGSIDRVTGDVQAAVREWNRIETSALVSWVEYFLKCMPAQRMF